MAGKKLGLIPHSRADRWALLALLHGGPHMAYYELCLVYSNYYEDSNLFLYHLIFFAFVMINIYSNLYLMRAADISNNKHSQLAQHTDGLSDKICPTCCTTTPPRCHHCKFCDVCVLKRDHHCWFAGTCVGYANHRYYFWLLVYLWSLAVYGNVFNVYHNASELFGFTFWTVLSIPMPHVYFVLGFYSLYQFYVAVIMTIGVVLHILISYLLCVQIIQLRKGQTEHERHKGDKQYNLGLKANIIDIFGERWYLTWLLPFIPSKLPGDGYVFKRSLDKIL